VNLIGVYWSPWHRRPSDYDYFTRLQPSVLKIMDGGPPDYQWVHQNLAQTLVVARDWAMSEQKEQMLNAPEATAEEHAASWNNQAFALGFDRARTLCLGINEPNIWDPGVDEALRRYTIRFLDELKLYNLRGGALQFSVGWPANTGDGTPPNWSPYAGVEEAILRGNHALVVHEYWADQGPREMWGWWGGRVLACPWNVPIIIGECGVDFYVKNAGGPHEDRGWQAVLNGDGNRYANELHEYATLMAQDQRVIGTNVFTSDFANGEWQSFDVEPAYSAILSLPHVPVNATGPTPPVQPEPGPVPPEGAIPVPPTGQTGLSHPLVQGGRVTQWWGATGLNPSGHEGTDFGTACGDQVSAIADGTVAWSDWDDDYGWYVRIYHPAYHIHSFYTHLQAQGIAKGKQVKKAQAIGRVGTTGNSTGCHLHFEVRLANSDGTYVQNTPKLNGRVDPESWCIMHGLDLSS